MVSWVLLYADLGHPGLQTGVLLGWLQPQMSLGAGCHLLSAQDPTLLLAGMGCSRSPCPTQDQGFSHELVGCQ